MMTFKVMFFLAECTAGLSCDSTIPSHYRKFQHTALATARAGISDSPREGSMSNGVSGTQSYIVLVAFSWNGILF